MMKLGEISNQVEEIQREALTGVLMVTGVGPLSPGPVTYTMRFERGELSRASGGAQLRGLAVVEHLCAAERLTQLRWMSLSPQSNWSGEPEIPAKWLAKLLGVAVNSRASETASKDESKEMLARVEAVFLQFYVGDAKADLAELARRHPPNADASAFLGECVQLLAPWIGEKEAKKLLSAEGLRRK